MRKLLSIGAVVTALLAPALSRAGVLTLGLRESVAVGVGDAGSDRDFAGGVSMSEYVPVQFPLHLDLLFRVTPGLAIGGYASVGSGISGDLCGIACSALALRAGVQAAYTFEGRVSPWLGGGAGREWNRLDDGSYDTTFSGWDVSVQGGVNWRLGRRFFLGPFAMAAVGWYDELDGAELSERATHAWVSLGIRGALDL